jgi:TonB family protein
MGFVLNCFLGVAGAGMFSLPFDLSDGPPAELPPLSRYEPPQFPPRLRATSIVDGYAKMMFTVDEHGAVEDAVALEASHPAFEQAVRSALEEWRFKSADSPTTPRREVIQFEFKRTGHISALSQRDASKAFFPAATPSPEERPIKTVSWDELPSLPERVASAAPAYPAAFRKQPTQGYASVSFVIDADGAVRVPVVLHASEKEFGESALRAVRQWRFTPPQHDIATVHVLAERSFTFGTGSRSR